MWGAPLRIKTARRKVASTKQFSKGKVHFQGGRVGRVPRWNGPLHCLRIGYLSCLSGLGGAVTNRGVVSKGGHCQSFGKLPPQRRGGVFDPTRLV